MSGHQGSDLGTAPSVAWPQGQTLPFRRTSAREPGQARRLRQAQVAVRSHTHPQPPEEQVETGSCPRS